ncbi:carboxylating nicotinate-nucleotide diphosphorylase [Lysinibacillus fusiformis]|jgi:nicotinate-nucleotide pyrophosphorylase (carboxylating)|uniref:carboxylating nicotinate-nucleotide diphosphorylase n=1 Tax=Lysinibacillus TaxID=400634 RepID=UPI0004D96BA7|nr:MULTISPECIES: carboxylating nicotinate-nucleotide diphosphorylase [Lysinibacillus]AJK86685.1 nicotinate-nucleotide pyrophosphorylase [Lysinibacillus fusiformis]KEK11138.1 nicotinate-nucleotide pyrophosphorylase [Lysinibacillus sphaericus]KHK48535.1 nicotinate-nucleotide pyrophosphorylase [Lysinibacillus sp. A1]MCE4046872.1 carboxylating nicotinate-nucleotide diphosphorylase [Lysinibacillus fusiformis]MCT6930726.1 carboxylating nicotinate-nucleotide diphosphorylase [Lysinibacillus fusiformis
MNIIKLEEMLKQFFNEDIGDGDLSSEYIFSPKEQGTFSFYAKESGIFCGAPIIEHGFHVLDRSIKVNLPKKDGEAVEAGDVIAIIDGPLQKLLMGERVILNLIQRMSAIATAAHLAVQEIAGTHTKICDTRKTIPGLRMLDKYAVRIGGAFNHRNGLYDAIMLKDNHIAFAGSLTNAIQAAREKVGHTVKIEVEIETKKQLDEAILAGADIIMFDNRSPEEIRAWLPAVPSSITTEASGGITLENIRAYAQTGIQWISLGSLTHSVKAFDISALVQMKGGYSIVHH